MITESTIREALRKVRDPELGRSIVDLNMVRRVSVTGGQVTVAVALTVAGCPLHQRISDDVQAAVAALPGVESVAVELETMTEAERRQLFARTVHQEPRDTVAPLLAESSPTAIIAVASGKGGVGKSTVTANLAVALHRLGSRVGVMDLDIYGFSQGRLFGVDSKAQVGPDQRILPWQAYGVHLVSMGMFVPEQQAIIWRGPMLGKAMQQFFQDVAWPPLDFLLLDLPPGTGDVALDIAQRVRRARLVLVTTPQTVATQVARRAAEVARRTGQEVLGVIENMSWVVCPHGERLAVFGEGGGQALATALGVPLLGQIPLEPALRQGGDEGRPLTATAPESETAEAFLAVAAQLRARVWQAGAQEPTRP
ncbi:MAG: Mrp/NBP35 family ATP-binding protein [Firmicutes bacterium]|nr:Mrp/NBP35 family ATP-binding protein [Alicyclobacillaceae bacterium]MCL6497657.1 Mrp/NBP35 family ATP-binding protein [Bacillota bacterium]